MSWVDDARDEAHRLRTDLDLGGDGIPDIFQLMEEDLSVAVFRRPLGDDAVDGILVVNDEMSAVLVNSSCTLGRQRFTAAHELGHLRIDQGQRLWVDSDVTNPGTSLPEKRANAFAAHFLMPPSGVSRIVTKYIDDQVTAELVVHLQRHFGVSYQSALWHLYNLGYMKRSKVDALANASPVRLALQLGYGQQLTAEADERNVVTVPREYAHRAYQAFMKGIISEERLGELLDRPLEELKRELDAEGIVQQDNGTGE